ncbi:MAG: L-fucose:H+ symporter permease [Endozoicomonadaceae bacterium]|nr:L-fucose:H+ symporter permease [Endozoicomonadaceae bacterium]MCY4330452.1 L-fucose:H+ symporter permease [Endozoicomonadaceae bacterium]
MNKNKKSSVTNNNKAGKIAMIFLVTLFFVWGALNNLNNILVAQFKTVFNLSDFQSGLVQSAFYFGYFFFAIPASLVVGRFSYKAAILVGLILVCIGVFSFYPAAMSLSYSNFLIALFVLAIGCAFLETSANPYISVLGGEDSIRYLNFAQSFNALGAIIAVILGKMLILDKTFYTSSNNQSSMTAKSDIVLPIESINNVVYLYIYIGIFIAVLGFLVWITRYPSIKGSAMTLNGYVRSLRKLSVNKPFLYGVLAQFLYIGAQTCVWSYTIRYCMYSQNITANYAADYLLASLIAFTCGRFFSTALLKYIQPNKLMGIYAIFNTLLCTYIIFIDNIGAVWSLVAISFFMSMMYPTIFTISIHNLTEDVPCASSILIMSILGGAVIIAGMGAVSDASNIAYAFVVPAICFIYIVFYSFRGSQPRKNS